MKIRNILIVSMISVMVLAAKPARAEHAVHINEMMVHPASGNDWIELYNPTASGQDITGWVIKDSASPLKTVSGTIAAGGFLIIDVTNRLNNAGDTVTLTDASGIVLDTYAYAVDPGEEQALGRYPDGIGTIEPLTTSTKGTQNTSYSSVPQASPIASTQPSPAAIGGTLAQGAVQLTEIYAAPPAGEQEWIEVYNTTEAEVAVGGWKIDDGEGGATPFTIPTEGNSAFIPPKSYKVFILSSARFNNSGDTVRLLSAANELIDQVTYGILSLEVSFAKDATGVWRTTTKLTPATENTIVSEQPKPDPTVKPTKSPQTVQTNRPAEAVLGTQDKPPTTWQPTGAQQNDSTVNGVLPQVSTASGKPVARVKKPVAQTKGWQSQNLLQYSIGTVCFLGVLAGYFFIKRRTHDPNDAH